MNWFMLVGEKVYICGKYDRYILMNNINYVYLWIGLMNINFYELIENINFEKVFCI